MTLDEAIKWYEDKESEYEYLSKEHEDFAMMAEQYQQFIEWFMELKDLKAEQNDQYVFIHELTNELEEAKRLLKAAVEDIQVLLSAIGEPMESVNRHNACEICEYNPECNCSIACTIHNGFKHWRFKDEALKLIEGE